MVQNFKQFVITDEETTFQRVYELLDAEGALHYRTLNTVKEDIMNSFSVSVYDGDSLIAFTRVLTDYSSVSIILDVVVDRRYRKNGLARAMFEFIKNHPKIGKTNQLLWSNGGEGFFSKLGFRKIKRELYFRK